MTDIAVRGAGRESWQRHSNPQQKWRSFFDRTTVTSEPAPNDDIGTLLHFCKGGSSDDGSLFRGVYAAHTRWVTACTCSVDGDALTILS
jgi:hypothetical protein